MAKLSYGDYSQKYSNGNYDNTNSVGFFSLKNDGDEAIVRIVEDSTDGFEMLSTHSITVNGKYRQVSCVRNDHDPVSKCPLCEAGNARRNRLFMKMIQYVKDPTTGAITPKAVTWERAASYAMTLASYMQNYGPLSGIVCKVIRHGAHGNLQTNYEMIPNLSTSIYTNELYPCDKTPFENYSVLGRSVMDRTEDEIRQYLATGEFPMRQRNDASTATSPLTQNNVQGTPVQPTVANTQTAPMSEIPESIATTFPTNVQPQAVPNGFTPAPVAEPNRMPWESAPQQTSAVQNQPKPWETSAAPAVGGVQRPTRYY